MSDIQSGETDNLPPRTESAESPADDNLSLWNTEEPLEEETIDESTEGETETEGEAEKEEDQPDQDEDEQEEQETDVAKAPLKFSGDLKFELDDGTVVTGEELKSQRLMHSDYSRKMADVAESRKAATTYSESAKATAERLTRFSQLLAERLEAQLPKAPDINDLMTGKKDGQVYAMELKAHESAMAFLNEISQAANATKETTNQILQSDLDMLRFEENMKLAEKLPETRSEKGRDKFYKEMSDFAKTTFGFSDDDAKTIDHRVWHLVSYAKKGFEAEQASKTAKAKIASAPTVKSAPKVVSSKPLSAADEALYKNARSTAKRYGFQLG